jgi:hypothetical protein
VGECMAVNGGVMGGSCCGCVVGGLSDMGRGWCSRAGLFVLHTRLWGVGVRLFVWDAVC